ncbi:MAG: GspE/PulE family protein [bacterium]
MAIFEQFDDKGVFERLNQLRREAEERDAKRRAETEGIPYIQIKNVSISLEALRLVPEEQARKAGMAVLQSQQKELAVAVVDISRIDTKQILHNLSKEGYTMKVFMSSESDLEEYAWKRYIEIKSSPEESLSSVALQEKNVVSIDELSGIFHAIEKKSANASTTDFISQVFSGAVSLAASDIHLEPKEKNAVLRFRIDGMLYPVYEMEYATYRLILNRIKLLSTLKINITNQPQDGRFTLKRKTNKDIEIRTSIIPSEYGETVVMRVLDPQTIALHLTDLGFRKEDIVIVEKELRRPNGMILVTGPTGSGKTTTLYAFLRHVQRQEIKVITIEDPIEYHLDGIEQTQVDAKTGYTFSAGLRSILRQDPDVILVGEIRDIETAEIGIHAALTGHLVFSTLHTNNALGAIPRLIDLGTKPSVIGPSLNLIIAQRLVRQLCPHCKKEYSLSLEQKTRIENFLSTLSTEITASYKNKDKIYIQGEGCDECRNGYTGRIGVFEIFLLKKEMHTMITHEISESDLQGKAREVGMVDIQSDGILKILEGITSIEEVERVTGPIEWWK